MIFIVNAENRSLFAADLATMHQHRKKIFIDRLHWRVPYEPDDERDQYDRDDTIYLLAKSRVRGELLASARLLPTTGPHLLRDYFAATCIDTPPRGPSVWEGSRFCPNPRITSSRHRVELFREIVGGIIECALLYGVNRVTFTANRALLPLALKSGWRCTILGPTLPDGSDTVTALCAAITVMGLDRVKSLLRSSGPLTRLISADVSLAA